MVTEAKPEGPLETAIDPHAGRKTGVNFHEKNRIAELAAEGLDAEKIGSMLLIEDEVVKSFMPKKGKGKKKAEDNPDFLK